MIYELRIDIEKVEPNGDCSRPVDNVLLCESDNVGVIEECWARLETLFPGSEWISNRDKAVYTVFAWKESDESDDYRKESEEIDLAEFTNLKKAKQLMKEVVETLHK